MKKNTCFFLLCFLFPTAFAWAQERPNIIFIMTDDHAEQAISSYGSTLIQTPNLDRIASEGIRYENSFVTNSICAPSRAVLLTGKYSHLNGLRDNRDEFDGSQLTFPKLLQQVGYQTAIVGKWHLKTKPTGFDTWKILIDQGEYYNPRFVTAKDTTTYPGYVTDLTTDFALDVIENRDESKPFLLLYHQKAPHRNWMPNTKHLNLFTEDLPLPETFFDTYENRQAAQEQDMEVRNLFTSLDAKIHPRGEGFRDSGGSGANYNADPAWIATYNRLTPEQKQDWDAHYDAINQAFWENNLSGDDLAIWKYQRYIKDYLRCIVSVDENVGRLLDYLDENGLAENTLVVYTSDQGFYLGEHGWYDKRFMYEESLGMPLMIRYPKEIPAGQVTEAMALNLDFAPTFLDYAHVAVPPEMQGKSLRALNHGDIPKDWRSSMYYRYYEYPHGWHKVKQHYGIRTERYKLIHFYNDIDSWELYDLQTDPRELQNLIDSPKHQDIVETLKAELQYLKEVYQDS